MAVAKRRAIDRLRRDDVLERKNLVQETWFHSEAQPDRSDRTSGAEDVSRLRVERRR
jgi:hypothetical protein